MIITSTKSKLKKSESNKKEAISGPGLFTFIRHVSLSFFVSLSVWLLIWTEIYIRLDSAGCYWVLKWMVYGNDWLMIVKNFREFLIMFLIIICVARYYTVACSMFQRRWVLVCILQKHWKYLIGKIRIFLPRQSSIFCLLF